MEATRLAHWYYTKLGIFFTAGSDPLALVASEILALLWIKGSDVSQKKRDDTVVLIELMLLNLESAPGCI